jgi:predicted Rossmann fold flavoprotein
LPQLKKNYSAVIIGAGAAGVFSANRLLDFLPPEEIIVLEQSKKALSKVKISGGGRCNVTHSCFDPKELVKNYPRGGKELLGPFSSFQPRDTVEWFKSRNVKLKTESDGRMFPTTDSSQTIIDCLLSKMREHDLIYYQAQVKKLDKLENGNFLLLLRTGEEMETQRVMLASGSTPSAYALIENLNHSTVPLLPSLFTFNIPSSPLSELAGISLDKVKVSLPKLKLKQTGPFLITHWGFSGPAVLKLSAWGARKLHDLNYQSTCLLDWLPETSEEELRELIKNKTNENSKKSLLNNPLDSQIPKNLWKKLLNLSKLDETATWQSLSLKLKEKLIQRLKCDSYNMNGKTTFKQEFVTSGGIKLSEVNFKTMESKKVPGLFFGGEVLNIDGITGGFNFQAAWTTGFLSGSSMSRGL